MPKINQEEYEVLKGLDDRWKWIARDEDGELYVYTTTPHKGAIYWINEDPMFGGIDDNIFQFIQWEDEEPYNIAELIEEYEREELRIITVKPHSFDVSNLEYGTRFSGSEETEVKKDIEWLKEEVNEIKKIISDAWGAAIIAGNQHFEKKNSSEMQIVKRISDLIDQLDEPEVTLDKAFEKVAESYSMTKEEIWRHLEQLEAHGGKVTYDEPEVLSQEWLDKHLFSLGDEYLWKEAVPVDDLQNLLVPRQELPVIPKFVADWIEDNKKQNKSIVFAIGHIYDENEIGKSPTEKENRIFQWMELADNDEVFARAWLDGYTVEEEQKYYVIDKEDNILLIRGYEGIEKADNLKIANSGGGALKLTKQEIKDYDERFWPFAVKVEELEE